MSQVETKRAGLSMAEIEELPQYRRLSAAAGGAFFFGLAAPLALIHPILWVVPVIGLILATLGLRATKYGDPPLSGRWLAVVGLVLSMVLIGWAPTRFLARRVAIENQARAFTEHWFETVKARQFKELHQLSRAPRDRRPSGVKLEDAYNVKPEEHGVSGEQAEMMSLEMNPQTLLNNFVKEYPLKELFESAARNELYLAWRDPPPPESATSYSRLAFDKVVLAERISNEVDQLKLIYLWETREDGLTRTRPITITVKRHRPAEDRVAAWQESSLLAPR